MASAFQPNHVICAHFMGLDTVKFHAIAQNLMNFVQIPLYHTSFVRQTFKRH